MRLQKLFFPVISVLALTSSAAFAFTCPDVENIRAVGLNYAHVESGGWITAYVPYHNYGTPEQWNFMLGAEVDGDTLPDENEAMRRGTAALASLAFEKIEEGPGFAICNYTTAEPGVMGFAMTPAMTPDLKRLR